MASGIIKTRFPIENAMKYLAESASPNKLMTIIGNIKVGAADKTLDI